MKTVIAYLIAPLVCTLIGVACLTLGLLDRDLARADEHVIASEYDQLGPILEKAERSYQLASVVPLVSSASHAAINDIRARRAAVQYWQRRYEALVPDQPDPMGTVPEDNIALQFITANAIYRSGLAAANDKATILSALETAATAYQTVLRNAPHHHDAAYNYEHVIKLRNEIDKGRRKAPAPEPSGGREGQPGSQPDTSVDDAKFKVYVPLEQEQLEKNKPGDAGKGLPIKKRG